MVMVITDNVMDDERFKIPFKDGRPCWWDGDPRDEERDNYEFEECLELYGFYSGRSSTVMILRPVSDRDKDFDYSSSVYYRVLLPEIEWIIRFMTKGVIYGRWTFVKRRMYFGIRLVHVIPGIHKCVMDMAKDDIFGIKQRDDFEPKTEDCPG